MKISLDRSRLRPHWVHHVTNILERFGKNSMRSALQREASRINGSKSKGPLTLETKAISSQNALRHGLTAQKHSLPGEEPQERAQRATGIANELNPQTELQHHLVGCINSAIDRQNRCDRALHGKLTKQQRALRREHQRQVAREVEDGIRLFEKGCPVQAILTLRHTAAGCRWLRQHWAALRDRLARYGILSEPDFNVLLRLHGEGPGRSATPLVCDLVYLAMGTWPGDVPFSLKFALREYPPCLVQQYQAQWPTRQAHCDELLRRLDAGMAELEARIAELEADEEAELEDAALDAMMIADPKEADLHLRYAKEADRSLSQALREYWVLKERQAALGSEGEDDEDIAAADEAAPEGESPPPEAASPAPTAEAVPAASTAWPEHIGQEIAAVVESLIELTAGLAPDQAWQFAQQSIATLPAGEVREAAYAAAEARFRNEPGARVGVSEVDMQQDSYVMRSGYRSAVLAGLREVERSMAAMAPSESTADPPLQR
jgi:hypothetical protein